MDGDVIGAACATKTDPFEVSDLLVAHTLSDVVGAGVDDDDDALPAAADEDCDFSELSDHV
jgi:hypothetical protein